MIRPATSDDLYTILEILPDLVHTMAEDGNPQWGPAYPLLSHFAADLEGGALFVDVDGDRLRGFCTFDQNESPEYQGLPWTVGQPALVIHRMATVPAFRRHGVADGFFAFAEDLARSQGLAAMKADTSDRNTAMHKLFTRRGWKQIGSLRFADSDLDFGAWEKDLS